MAIRISKKDRSLLLFIATLFVVAWFVFSFLANLIFSSAYAVSDAAKMSNFYENQSDKWLNVSRPLTKDDLKNRVVLLDFWTYACVNCLHMIPEIKKLENEFGNKLLVIGVHSGKFDNEKDVESIKKAVLRFEIEHPVVNDSDFKIWNHFKVDAWPSFILLDPKGRVKNVFRGEGEVDLMRKDIKKLVNKYRHHLNREDLPILLEKNKVVKTVLSYPTKIIYAKEFSYKSFKAPAFFIANSANNTILATRMNGEVIVQIGSKNAGFEDGFLENARFNAPSGLAFDGEKLYVADTGNHALRVVDFDKMRVETLAGKAKRGSILLEKKVRAREFALASPMDLEFFPDKNHVAIANSGTHQIFSYDIKNQTLSLLAGNGREGIDDGFLPYNSLAQTSDLSAYDGKLYFLDSETSSLRLLEKNGKVTTLLGKGLFDFGHKNGGKNDALMQHPLGLFVNKNGAYISDSFNHLIRKYQFSSKTIKDLFGKERGDVLGKEMLFNEPDGLVIINDEMFVVDANNNRIVKIDFDKMSAGLLHVMPKLQLPREGFLQYLPNLQQTKKIIVKSQGARIVVNFEDGWKINEKGPSFLNLLELIDDDKANLVQTFDWNMIKNGDLSLPKLQESKKYVVQGTIYFCEDKKDALCYIESYDQKIEVDSSGEDVINIEL